MSNPHPRRRPITEEDIEQYLRRRASVSVAPDPATEARARTTLLEYFDAHAQEHPPLFDDMPGGRRRSRPPLWVATAAVVILLIGASVGIGGGPREVVNALSQALSGARSVLTQPDSDSTPSWETASLGTLRWMISAPMPTERAEHGIATLSDGTVIVAGGRAQESSLSLATTTDLYDPRQDRWRSLGGFLQSRVRFGNLVPLADGSALVAGGMDRDGTRVLSSVERFKPGLGLWAATGELAQARADAALAVLSDGRVLISGGRSAASGDELLDSVEIYDPLDSSWAPAGSLSTPRADHHALRLLDGRVLVMGGISPDTPAEARLEIFDPADGVWSDAGSLISGRQDAAAVVLPDGRVIVSGGHNGKVGDAYVAYLSAELYDPSTGQARQIAPMQRARIGHHLHILPGGLVIAIGGESTPDQTITTEVYDPGRDEWRTGPPVILAASGSQSTVLSDGRILVTGGWLTSTTQAPTSATASTAILAP